MSNYFKGYDISALQGSNIDFVGLKNSGISFIIHRCGVGNTSKDHLYDQNIAAANAAGLYTAAYHFIFPLPFLASQPLHDPTKQAQLHAGWANGMQYVFCDAEWPYPRNWSRWSCSAPQIVEWMTTYLEAYEAATGVRQSVYTYPSYAESIKLPTEFGQKYKLWIASYTAKPVVPKPWNDWYFWQSSGGTEKLPNGVAVDVDYSQDLSLWQSQSVAIPLPAPITIPAPVDPTPAPDPVVASPMPAPAPAPVPAAPTSTLSWWQTLITTLSNLFK